MTESPLPRSPWTPSPWRRRGRPHRQAGGPATAGAGDSSRHFQPENGGPRKSYWFQVKATPDDVERNGEHRQHRPGAGNCATEHGAPTPRGETKGVKGIHGPRVLLQGARQKRPRADPDTNLEDPFEDKKTCIILQRTTETVPRLTSTKPVTGSSLEDIYLQPLGNHS